MQKLIYLILILLPTYLLRFEILGVPFTVLEVLILGLFLWFLYKKRTTLGLSLLGTYKYLVILFLIAGTVGAVVAEGSMAAMGLWKAYVLEPVLFFIVFINVKPNFKKTVQALSIGALFVAAVGIIQYFTGYGIPNPWNVVGDDYRVTSIFEYPNAVGLYLTSILLLSLGYLVKFRKKSWLIFGVVCLGLAAILFSQTQGALAGFVFGVWMLGMLTKRWKWVFFAGGLIGLGIMLIYPATQEVLLFQDTSGEVRLALWEGTSNLLQANPLTGAGLGNFPEMYEQYKLNRHVELLLYPHNLFLNFWVEFGILGLVWIVGVLLKYFGQGFWKRDKKKTILIAAMAGVVLYGMVDVVYFKNDLAIIFWTLLGLMEIVSIKNNK